MFVIKKFTKKIQISLITALSLSFSLNCSSESKIPGAMPESKKIEYICGKKCFSIDKVIFEIKGDDSFINDRSFWSTKMAPFNGLFKNELLKLKTAHKINFGSGFRVDRTEYDLTSLEGILQVYVRLDRAPCDLSMLNFSVVSLSKNGIGFQELKCKMDDNKCIDKTLSDIFEKHVVENIKDIEDGVIVVN